MINALRTSSIQVSSRNTMKPPMLTMPSFLALIVAPSAYENISAAISAIDAFSYPGSRILMNIAFSAKRHTSRMNGLPYCLSNPA